VTLILTLCWQNCSVLHPGGPNPAISGRRLWQWTIAQRLVTGRWAWEVETSGDLGQGQIRALWPLVSAMIEPIPASGGDDYFSGYVYGRNELTRRTLVPDQVVYRWNPSLSDFRQPESVLQAARLNISVAIMQDKYDVAFLRNDARPAAVIVHQEFADKSDESAFRDQFISRHAGPDNAGRPIFLRATEGDEDVSKTFHIETLGLNQRDAEFIARHDREIQAICVAFGTGLSLLGDASARTFDNASQENTNWWEGTLLPLVHDLQDDVNISLAPRLGREVGWFDISGVRALQKSSFIEVLGNGNMVALVQAGVLVPDEIRGEVGLEPLPDDMGSIDGLVAQADLQAQLDDANAQIAALTPVPDASASAVPEGASVKPEIRASIDRAQRMLMEYRTVDSHIKALERSWQSHLSRAFQQQGRDAIRKLRSRGRRIQRVIKEYEARDEPTALDSIDATVEAHAIFDKQESQQLIADVVDSLYEEVVNLAGSRVTNRYGGIFTVEAPWVQQFINTRTNQLAGAVSNTTYRGVQRALSKGIHAGDSIDDLASRVQHVFDIASDSRARTIARTEVISAYNGSTYQAAGEAPRAAVAGLAWLSTPGQRTRPAHSAADGQTISVGGMFSVGGDQLRFPGDPNGRGKNIINCRCTVVPLTPDEMEGRSKVLVGVSHATTLLSRMAVGEIEADDALVQLYTRSA
jgi:HK97 family phage portal protein